MVAGFRSGWLFASCFFVAGLHPKTGAATAESAATSTDDRQQHNKPRRQTFKEQKVEVESGVSCYTCVNVSDNLMCNRYAIEHPCPKGESFCHTLHIMDSRGASVVVNKKCADPTECTLDRVGCLQIDTQKVCVSCCDATYCNVSVPTNHSTAFYMNTKQQRQTHINNNNLRPTDSFLCWWTLTIAVYVARL